MRVVLTGVPGTGKTKLAGALAKKLGWKLISLNALVEKHCLWNRKDRFGTKIVRLKALEKKANEEMMKAKNAIVEGHLACDLRLPADRAIVLRCNPELLASRLAKRNYPKEKTKENMECELIDYCTFNAEKNYKKVYEIRTEKGFKNTLAKALKLII